MLLSLSKALFYACLLVWVGVFTSCKSKTPPAAATETLTGIDAEAKAEAEKFWQARLVKCGEDWNGLGYLTDRVFSFIQVKNPQLQLKAAKLSEADKLNGFTWSGTARMTFQTYRIYLVNNWDQWRTIGGSGSPQQHLFIDFAKKNGQWVFNERPTTLRPVACEKVPKE